MFTQCPQCEAAFRITAEVLQQARGQVRCGSCNTAFNALDHLSEEPPTAATPAGPASGNDARSQALLQTLNKLAGPDEIRIEDTGIEWLVVDDDDAQEETDGTTDPGAAGSIKWILEGTGDGDLPVPEVANPIAQDDELETAETAEQLVLDEQAAIPQDESQASEARYDDNTPLPDDFEAQHDYVPSANTPLRRATDPDPANAEIAEVFEEAQTELELSEPGDWMDLLDEFSGAPDVVDADAHETTTSTTAAAQDAGTDNRPADELPLDVEEELAAIHDELSSMPDRRAAPSPEAPLELAVDDLDIELNTETGSGDEVEPTTETETGDDPDVSIVASQLDDLLEAMGSGKFKSPDVAEKPDDAEPAADDDSLKFEIVDDAPELMAADSPTESETSDSVDPGSDKNADTAEEGDKKPGDDASDVAVVQYEETTGEFERAIADAEGEIRAALEEPDGKPEAGTSATDKDADDRDQAAEADVAGDPAGIGRIDPTDDDHSSADNPDEDLVDDLAAMTGSMQIDAKLLRAMQDGSLDSSMTDEDGSPIIETIIMEGDFVRGALHGEKDEEDFMTGENKPPPHLPDPGSLIDTYISNRDGEKGRGLFSGKRAIAGAVILLLLLVGQILHYSRESLATSGLFNQTLGPVYRLFGEPVTPTWDIKGWQFEATSGSTDETDSLLTVSSRISNRSQQPLPYPLVHISLTDRYEEIVGSKILEPIDYLAGGADPSRPVAAGDSFTAVITIASPADEATGFKLNVCYRVAPGRVRCAIEDFKAP